LRPLLAITLATLGAPGLGHAQSTFLDTDFFCRVKGCVIVHDSFSFDVYDAHIFANNGTVPVGGELIAWSGNPFQGTGDVRPVFTGTRTEGTHIIFENGQGAALGFANNGSGNGPIANLSETDTNGFLDAEDVFAPITLRRNTAIRAVENSIQRSFYLSSRTIGFGILAEARARGLRDSFNTEETLNNVVFDYGITQRGTDDGFSYGSDARRGRFRRLNGFNSLGDITGTAQIIADFRDPIRRRASDNLGAQSIRFDYVYGFEDYDLSLGAGALNYEIEFRFIRQ